MGGDRHAGGRSTDFLLPVPVSGSGRRRPGRNLRVSRRHLIKNVHPVIKPYPFPWLRKHPFPWIRKHKHSLYASRWLPYRPLASSCWERKYDGRRSRAGSHWRRQRSQLSRKWPCLSGRPTFPESQAQNQKEHVKVAKKKTILPCLRRVAVCVIG